MNKSHITEDQVKIVLQMYWHADNPSKIFSNVDIQDMRRSLEAAFPEPSIQELLRDEERSARHDYPQQPAGLSDERFARCVQIYKDKTQVNGGLDLCAFRSAIDAALVPTVDAKEQAWKEYCSIVYNPDEHDFKAGYEAGQANNCPKD